MKNNISLIICVLMILLFTSCSKKMESNNNDNLVLNDETELNIETEKFDDKTGLSSGEKIHYIHFEDNVAFLDGKKVNEYNYVWNIDINGDYDEVKDSPSEYYTGERPNDDSGIWIAHDVKYFPLIEKSKFYKTNINDNPEWCVNFENKKYKNFAFASLPRSIKDEFPDYMMHTKEEAYDNPCFHITMPGTYELSGKWNGQIFVDLGKNSEEDESKKIKLILNNLEANCTVAPAINIYKTYECDNKWEDREEPLGDIDLSEAGIKIILKDNAKNYINGANVYRIYQTKFKKDGIEQKKAIKYDGALQSAMSLCISAEALGNGELYVNGVLEGISSDLHLEVNGGKIYINADNDGINCSETGVSIFKINDGTLMVNSGLGYEGDGLDSNGYTIINGGNVVAVANYELDPGVDSVNGVLINGGSLVALGEPASIDWAKVYMGENANQSYVFKSFDDVIKEDTMLSVIDENGNVVYEFSENDFPHISDEKRPFRGVLISNPNIKKDINYEVVATN